MDTVDQLPADNRADLGACRQGSAPMVTDNFAAVCTVSPDSDPCDLFVAEGVQPQMTFSLNETNARDQRARIRDGDFVSDRYSPGETVKDAAGAGVAAITQYTATDATRYWLKDANNETMLYVSTNDFVSAEAAKEWLKSKGLL